MDERLPIKAPPGATGFSFEGVEYAADANGVVRVPAEAVRVAVESFGFTALDPSQHPAS